MRRTSATRPAPEFARRGGYSILELLIVLAIMALATAIVLPRGALMLDRLVLHVVQFDFQRQISALRAKAYAEETPIEVLSSDAAGQGPQALSIPLRAHWAYRLDRPVRITAGGGCSPANVEVLKLGQPMMHLRSIDAACHFIRLD